VEWTGTKELT